MAVALVLRFEGLGQDNYDAVMKELGFDGPGATGPEGIVSHTAGKSANGWCVVDIWESEAPLTKFSESTLGPAFAKVGDVPEPTVTAFQVHNRYPAG